MNTNFSLDMDGSLEDKITQQMDGFDSDLEVNCTDEQDGTGTDEQLLLNQERKMVTILGYWKNTRGTA